MKKKVLILALFTISLVPNASLAGDYYMADESTVRYPMSEAAYERGYEVKKPIAKKLWDHTKRVGVVAKNVVVHPIETSNTMEEKGITRLIGTLVQIGSLYIVGRNINGFQVHN